MAFTNTQTTFGNPFGLALYDRDQAGVRKPRNGKATSGELETGPWVLRGTGASDVSFDTAENFVGALHKAMSEASYIELLFTVWEQNVDTVRAINKSPNQSTSKMEFAQSLVKHLKACAVALAKNGNAASKGGLESESSAAEQLGLFCD